MTRLLKKEHPYNLVRLKSNDFSFQNAVLEEKDDRQTVNFCVIHDVLATQ